MGLQSILAITLYRLTMNFSTLWEILMSKNLDQAEKALLEQIAHYEQGAAYYTECAARAKDALQQIQSIRNFENVALRQATEFALTSKKGVRAAVKHVVAEVSAPKKVEKTAKKKKVTAKKDKPQAATKLPKTGEDFWLNILAGGESLSTAQIRDSAVAIIKEQGRSLSEAELKKLDKRISVQLSTMKNKEMVSAKASGQGRTKLYTIAKTAPVVQPTAA
jgi:exonuclease VII small subunit